VRALQMSCTPRRSRALIRCMRTLLCALVFLCSCDPAVRRVVEHYGDSTSYQLIHFLNRAGSLREAGDLWIEIASVPTYGLVRNGDYFAERANAAHAFIGTNAQWVVVQLGTNDLAYVERYALIENDALLDASIESFLAVLPPAARVLWVMPSPNLPADRLERYRAALERSPRKIEIMDLPVELYETAGNHFSDPKGAADRIVARLDELDAEGL